ncbi:hypothetical protein ABZU94_39150 [Streptomyces mirabilis]|uniref:hypothetical protein n=1 Tax=Streptomyces sp. NPDC005388 TaxID=3156717 RepID=UPI0033BD356D
MAVIQRQETDSVPSARLALYSRIGPTNIYRVRRSSTTSFFPIIGASVTLRA